MGNLKLVLEIRNWKLEISNFQFLICIFNFFIIFSPLYSSFSQNPKWYLINSDNSGLPDDMIRHVSIDLKNRIWVCSNNAVSCYTGSEWIHLKRKSKRNSPENIPRLCASDNSGNVWVGTWGDGMSRLLLPDSLTGSTRKNSIWLNYYRENSPLASNTLNCLTADGDNNVWMGTDNGLMRITLIDWNRPVEKNEDKGLRWTVFDTANSGIPVNKVRAVSVDKRGVVWIGTFGGGVAKYDGMFWTVYTTRNSGLPDNFIVSVAIDEKNHKWIGTKNGGVACFDGREWEVHNKTNSTIPDNRITLVQSERAGKIWAGTYDSGLAYFDPNKTGSGKKPWSVCSLFDRNIPYSVTSLAIDKNNNKWIGTAGGLIVFNENGIRGIDLSKK